MFLIGRRSESRMFVPGGGSAEKTFKIYLKKYIYMRFRYVFKVGPTFRGVYSIWYV